MQRQKQQRGSALTEFGLMLPILLVIMAGTIDFSRVFHSAVVTVGASRAGVQYGARSNVLSGDFAGMNLAASQSGADAKGTTITSERLCRCQSGAAVSCTSTCPEGVPQIYVRTTTTRSFETLTKFPGIPETVNLGSRATFRVQ